MDYYRFPILASLALAFILAAIGAIPSGFHIGTILLDFLLYSSVFVGLILVLGSGGIKMLKSLFEGKGGKVRPNRSRTNELGSGDMAGTDTMEKWLKPTDENDTVLAVTDIVGNEKIKNPGDKLYIPGEERNRHLLFIAKTGSGKTTKAILPILYSDCLSKHRSSVIIDSKPEMWEKLAGMTAELNPEKKILLFNPLDTLRSLSWNIVGKVEDDTDAKLIANTLIMATDPPGGSKGDGIFFKNNALQLLNAIMVGLLNDNDELLSIPRVHELIHSGKNALCDWIEVHPAAIRNAKTFVELARSGSQNADTVLSELSMRLAAWDLKAIRSTTFAEELDLQTLIDEPTLFILEFRESEIEMLRPMANVVVIEILRYLTKAAEKYPGHRLPRPVGLVIDEFASALGRLPDIHVKLNTLRSRNVSITAAIQSVAQIKANYEKDADSVLAGFSSKILMPMLDFQDAEWASKETGTMTVRFKVNNSGANRRAVDAFAHMSKGYQEQVQQRAVLTPDEIGRPVDNCATFFLPNTPVFQAHMVPFYEDKAMSEHIGSGEKDYRVRTEPIEYEEKLPDKETLVAEQKARAAAQAGGGGQAVGAIQPVQREMTPEEIQARLEELKAELGWESTTGVAREWWETFEAQNSDKLGLVITLGEEIKKRDATITEFFLAYLYSNTDSIEGNLEYLEKMKAEQANMGTEQSTMPVGAENPADTVAPDQAPIQPKGPAEANTNSAIEASSVAPPPFQAPTGEVSPEGIAPVENRIPIESATEAFSAKGTVNPESNFMAPDSQAPNISDSNGVVEPVASQESNSHSANGKGIADVENSSVENSLPGEPESSTAGPSGVFGSLPGNESAVAVENFSTNGTAAENGSNLSRAELLEKAINSPTIRDYLNVAESMLERNTLNPQSVNSIIELARAQLGELVGSDEELTKELVAHLKTEMLGVYLRS